MAIRLSTLRTGRALLPKTKQTNFVVFSPRANYTERATAACRRCYCNFCSRLLLSGCAVRFSTRSFGCDISTQQTPCPESEGEPYRSSDRRLSVKLVPNLRIERCCVVSKSDPYGRILGFLDRSRYYFFQVASQLYSRCSLWTCLHNQSCSWSYSALKMEEVSISVHKITVSRPQNIALLAVCVSPAADFQENNLLKLCFTW
jgi:hypothetical protein